MVAIISADIINSRNYPDSGKWLNPLKTLLKSWGKQGIDWVLERGDFIQLEVKNPADALQYAFRIKTQIKMIPQEKGVKKSKNIDIRIAIGIGEKNYEGETLSESQGQAFTFAGDKLEELKKNRLTMQVKSSHHEFDRDVNLFLRLCSLFMDDWTISSAEVAAIVLHTPHITQKEIGKRLNIRQNTVSDRWKRAHIDEMLAVEKRFREKIKAMQ